MTDHRAKFRIAIGLAAMAGLLAWSVVRMTTDPSALPIRDFVEYYSAGRVFLDGGNPYSGPELVAVQRRVLNQPDLDDATMMWNPPWVLTLVAPFAALPIGVAHKLWLLGQMFFVFASVWMLWRVYGGPKGKEWVGWVVAATFPPVFFVVWWGQIGGLVLLGLAGYLFNITRGRPVLAGLFAALTAIKPHLLFAFGLVLVLEALVSSRGRKVVSAGALAVAAAAVVAWVVHPAIYEHYRHADWESSSTVNVSPKDWIQPLASYWLRVAVDPNQFGIQFVPTVVVAVVGIGYWLVKRKFWHWPTELPRLVFASVIAAAYGAWLFDLVVLLVPVVQVAARLTKIASTKASATGPKSPSVAAPRLGEILSPASGPPEGLSTDTTLPPGDRDQTVKGRRTLLCLGAVYGLLMAIPAFFPTLALTPLTGLKVGLQYYIWFAPVVLLFYVAALRATRPYNALRESPSGTPERASAWRTPAAVPGTGSSSSAAGSAACFAPRG